MKPNTPITRREMYLDVATGGSTVLPTPVIIEEKYLAKIAGMSVDLPTPVTIKHKFLAKIAGMQVDVPTYTTDSPRIYAYLAKAAGQNVEVPTPTTREEMYWYDYVNTQPVPVEEYEYTGPVPVSFVAIGEPLIDYTIYGNTVQNVTPTPDSPIMPQGTGERTGNLFDYKTVYSSFINNNGNISTTANALTSWNNFTAADIGKTITVSMYVGSISASYIRVQGQIDGNYITGNAINAGSTGYTEITVTPTSTSDRWRITYGTGTPAVVLNQVMVAVSATRKDYEPYGIKIPISSASTTTPVYLGEVESTRRIKKLVLTGEEDWVEPYESLNVCRLTFNGYLREMINIPVCTHYTGIVPVNEIEGLNNLEVAFLVSSSGNNYLYIRDDDCTTDTEFKSYLAQQYANGTPVIVWYALTEPEIAVVNEPLMKIGDYADTLSMEQAGVEIPTIRGNNTLDVLTDVKPSQMYIKYKGEPVIGQRQALQLNPVTSSTADEVIPEELLSDETIKEEEEK